jgi:hypothetical protein
MQSSEACVTHSAIGNASNITERGGNKADLRQNEDLVCRGKGCDEHDAAGGSERVASVMMIRMIEVRRERL